VGSIFGVPELPSLDVVQFRLAHALSKCLKTVWIPLAFSRTCHKDPRIPFRAPRQWLPVALWQLTGLANASEPLFYMHFRGNMRRKNSSHCCRVSQCFTDLRTMIFQLTKIESGQLNPLGTWHECSFKLAWRATLHAQSNPSGHVASNFSKGYAAYT